MSPIVNPFKAAAVINATMAQIFEANVKMQIDAGVMVLQSMRDALHTPPDYAVDGKIVYIQKFTPKRYAEATAG